MRFFLVFVIASVLNFAYILDLDYSELYVDFFYVLAFVDFAYDFFVVYILNYVYKFLCAVLYISDEIFVEAWQKMTRRRTE